MDSLHERDVMQPTNITGALSTNVSTEDRLGMKSLHLGILFAAFVPLSLCIVVGNFLVIATVFRESRLHSPTNFILASLGVADFIIGVLTIPFEVYTDTQTYLMSCDTVTYLLAATYFMSAVSLMHQIVVTTDRFFAIWRPLRYTSLVTGRRVALTLVSVWFGGTFPACAFLAVWMITYGEEDTPVGKGECGGGAYFSVPRIQKFELSVAILVIIGLLLLTIFNLYIWRVAIHQANQIEDQICFINVDHKRKKVINLQATKTVLGIVGTFIVSWTPFTIFFTLSSQKQYETLEYHEIMIINQICFFLICLNSAVNPLIYGWKNKEFRRGLVRLLKKLKFPCLKEQPMKRRQTETVNEASMTV